MPLAPLPPFRSEEMIEHRGRASQALPASAARPAAFAAAATHPRSSLTRTLVRLGRKKDATAQLEAFLAEARKDDRLRLRPLSGPPGATLPTHADEKTLLAGNRSYT